MLLLLAACGGEDVRTPDLRQQFLWDAMDAASEAGLRIAVPATDDYRNTVMRHSPAPGTKVARDTLVRVISFHPTPADADRPWPCPESYDDHAPRIPAGTPLGDALERVARSGHAAEVSALPDVPPTTKGFDAYVVEAQSPAAGRFIRCSARIILTVGVEP